jgi:arabinose-5-phosphate isomerase
MGALLVLRGDALEGLFTESDLRRLITGSGGQFDALLQRPVGDFVTRQPMTIAADRLASEAIAVLEEKRVGRLVCVDGDKPVGLLAWHNLLQHKVA